MSKPPRKPTYPLADIQALIRANHYALTKSARNGMAALGFEELDVTECVCALTMVNFHKTMPALKRGGGFYHDVYLVTWCGEAVYLKLQIDGRAVVISFKRDEGGVL